MFIKLNVSKLERSTIVKIAEQTNEEDVLEKIAKLDDIWIIQAVINNPATTRGIRAKIYDDWKDKDNRSRLIEWLVACPLDMGTINKIIENEAPFSELVAVQLAKQGEISIGALEIIYNLATGSLDKKFTEKVLSVMARRDDLTEEMVNKLLKYSPSIASIVAETYGKYLRVDFSQGQTE